MTRYFFTLLAKSETSPLEVGAQSWATSATCPNGGRLLDHTARQDSWLILPFMLRTSEGPCTSDPESSRFDRYPARAHLSASLSLTFALPPKIPHQNHFSAINLSTAEHAPNQSTTSQTSL